MLLNRRLPGPGTRILAQDLRFEGVIGVGREVTAREKRPEGAIVQSQLRGRMSLELVMTHECGT